MKVNRSVLEEKLSLKMLGLSFSSKLDWGLLHYLYYLQEIWSLDLFYEAFFSGCCSVSL